MMMIIRIVNTGNDGNDDNNNYLREKIVFVGIGLYVGLSVCLLAR